MVKESIHYIKLDFKKEVIAQIMSHLYHLEIQSLIVEGGAYTLNAFIKSGHWDEAKVFEGGQIFKNGIESPSIGVAPFSKEEILDDIMYVYKNNNEWE